MESFDSNIKMSSNKEKKDNEDKKYNCFNYDVIIDSSSIKNLNTTGWKIIYSGNKKEKREMIELKEKTIISFLGPENRGKTYLLQKLTESNIEPGYQTRTKGVNMKFHDDIIFLDIPGPNSPLLLEGDMKRPNEAEITNEHFCHIITNYIIQTFAINQADILICVVGLLFSEEFLFLKKIKKLFKNKKKLIVIHNLVPCNTIEDIEKYKNDVLLKLMSVEFEEKKNPFFDKNNENIFDKYFIEKGNDNIKHFIYGNDKNKSKEMDYYNKTTLAFIKNFIKTEMKKSRDLFRELIDHIKNISSLLLQKEISPKIKEDLIKCDDKEISPRYIICDQFDNNIVYEPNYRFYRNGQYFIFEIQICSKIFKVEAIHSLDISTKETIFKINGERKLDISDEKDYLINKRNNFKNFKLLVKVKLSDFDIKNINKEPEIRIEYGILFIIYKIL